MPRTKSPIANCALCRFNSPWPRTEWLRNCVALDDHGFVKTGADLRPEELAAAHWPLGRAPYLMETSLPGIFAAGDVRASANRRIAAAVGEGSAAIFSIHQYLRSV